MLYKLVIALSLSSVSGMAFTKCAATGADCTGSSGAAGACCTAGDECEAVNTFYSKCVSQPTCAAKNAQCAGKGDSIMRGTACCDTGFECFVESEWYSSCKPPQPTCAKDEGQCGGTLSGSMLPFSPLACCSKTSQCMEINKYYSKCVAHETCAADNALCEGTGTHVKPATPCCSDQKCVAWGDNWSVCRDAAHATCSDEGEQCAGAGESAMKEKSCCDPTNTCVAVNQFYSKCDKATTGEVSNVFFGALSHTGYYDYSEDKCPGLNGCSTKASDFSLRGAPKPTPFPFPQDCSHTRGKPSGAAPDWFVDCEKVKGGCFKIRAPKEQQFNLGNTTFGASAAGGTQWCIDHLQGWIYNKVVDPVGAMYYEVDDISHAPPSPQCRFLVGAEPDSKGSEVYHARAYNNAGITCNLAQDGKPAGGITVYDLTITMV